VKVIGIGTDIVECLRIARMIERHGELFLNRVFTPAEIRFCMMRKQATQTYAGRWAAKEAVFKALGIMRGPGLRWLDLDIREEKPGKVTVGMRGGVRDAVLERGVREIMVTIAHCRSHATATAIVVGPDVAIEDVQ
jgi:holo-[acyl-carrier protein] synthase